MPDIARTYREAEAAERRWRGYFMRSPLTWLRDRRALVPEVSTALSCWVLLDETPSDDWEGLSLIGLFSSRAAAFDYLLTEVIGEAAEVRWQCSPHNPGYWEGWRMEDDEEIARYLCVREEVLA